MSTRPYLSLALVLSALAGCAPTAEPAAELLPVEAAPPGFLDLSITPFVPGTTVTLSAARVPVGATVTFYVGGNAQPGQICPSGIAPTCLALRGPLFVTRTATGDANGLASTSLVVPGTVAPGTGLGVQASLSFAGTTWLSDLETTVVRNGTGDPDGDGLTTADEIALGTDPVNADTDGDVLDDLEELLYGTDPLDDDTDGDLLIDGWEEPFGTDPLDPDTEGDGVLDGWEFFLGTNPLDSDSDEDGWSDLYELQVSRTNPALADTDADGCADGIDTSPRVLGPDADGDDQVDSCDPCPLDAADDSDGDGSCDTDDLCPGADDGLDGDGDGQPDACDPCPQDNPDDPDGDGFCGTPLRVFVTAQSYSPGDLGPLVNADGACETSAFNAGLGGSWVAWLSVSNDHAIDRLGAAGAAGPWVRTDGVMVAMNFGQLSSGSLLSPINRTEAGFASNTSVWTGTFSGGYNSGRDCGDFQNTSPFDVGTIGFTNSAGPGWTDNGIQFCQTALPIYCFEVP